MGILLLLVLGLDGPCERAVSPDGRHYVLAYRHGYEFYERSPDHPVLLDAPRRMNRRRPEDRLLFSGEWNLRPQRVRVLDRQPAFVAWGRGSAALYGARGLRWKTKIGAHQRPPWVSEQLGLLVLDLEALELKTGAVRKVTSKVYLLGSRHGKPWERHSAMESVARHLPDGTVAAMERLMRDHTQEIDMQAHAAAVARLAGSKLDTESLIRAGLDSHAAPYLVPYAYDVLGDEALPLLEWAITRDVNGRASGAEASRALARVGAKALPILIRTVKDRKLVPGVRINAARALGVIRDERALPLLAAVVLEPHNGLATVCLGACISIGGKRLPAFLSTILEQGSIVDDKIVYHFMRNPSPEAAPGLMAELKRAPKNTPYQRQVIELISRCRRGTPSLRR